MEIKSYMYIFRNKEIYVLMEPNSEKEIEIKTGELSGFLFVENTENYPMIIKPLDIVESNIQIGNGISLRCDKFDRFTIPAFNKFVAQTLFINAERLSEFVYSEEFNCRVYFPADAEIYSQETLRMRSMYDVLELLSYDRDLKKVATILKSIDELDIELVKQLINESKDMSFIRTAFKIVSSRYIKGVKEITSGATSYIEENIKEKEFYRKMPVRIVSTANELNKVSTAYTKLLNMLWDKDEFYK